MWKIYASKVCLTTRGYFYISTQKSITTKVYYLRVLLKWNVMFKKWRIWTLKHLSIAVHGWWGEIVIKIFDTLSVSFLTHNFCVMYLMLIWKLYYCILQKILQAYCKKAKTQLLKGGRGRGDRRSTHRPS